MKSKDLQKLVLSKYEAGQTPKNIFQDLNGAVSYRTVKQWCQMIRRTGAIDLSKPSVCHRTAHTKAVIQKIKRKSKGSKRISCRKLALEMDISFSNAYRILGKDLKMMPYKKTVEPLLKDDHKAQRKKFANWARKKIQWESFFPMKKCLILTGSITEKMIVYGPLIGRKQIGEVKKNSKETFQKKWWYGERALRLLFCLIKALSIIIVTSRKYCLLLYDTETVNLETTGPSNKTTEHHILTKRHKNGVPNISWQGYMASE